MKNYFCGNGMLKNNGNRKRVLLECCSSSMGHWHGSLGAHDVLIEKGKIWDGSWFRTVGVCIRKTNTKKPPKPVILVKIQIRLSLNNSCGISTFRGPVAIFQYSPNHFKMMIYRIRILYVHKQTFFFWVIWNKVWSTDYRVIEKWHYNFCYPV